MPRAPRLRTCSAARADEAARALEHGLPQTVPHARASRLGLADGGEGAWPACARAASATRASTQAAVTPGGGAVPDVFA
ncbi:glycerate kinase [Streptomyces shenzhenensis]|uniref:glycerate kinase n=1 Tax=Streptomyces shenzhenensis TaxID=943815 RepID=UPI0035591E4A